MHTIVMHMSSQRYINAASEYKYICILIYNTFCSATFYNDPPMITHAVAQELGPQEVKQQFGQIGRNKKGKHARLYSVWSA